MPQENKIKFTKAVAYHLNPIRLPVPFYDASLGPFDYAFTSTWIELHADDGVVGMAPCSEIMEKDILPRVMTGESKTYDEWYRYLYWQFRNTGFQSRNYTELAAFDLACHDIMAKRANLPLHRYLGATRDYAEVYGSGCGTSLDGKAMSDELEVFLESGFKCIKMKIGTDFGTCLDYDIKRVALARKTIGPNVKLALDANQIWKCDEALAFAKMVEEYDIMWFEEPTHSHDFVELGKLTQVSPIPISMGESMRNQYMFDIYIEKGVHHLQPNPLHGVCSVKDWMMVRDKAYANGRYISSGGVSQLTASFIATAPENAMVEYLRPVIKPFIDTMEIRPEEKEGRFYLPMTPGISLRPDYRRWEKEDMLAGVTYYKPDAR